MSNHLGTYLKKKLVGKGHNLVTLEEPYHAMAKLLRRREVRGIIDAGASDGRISRRFIKLFDSASVHAFEPNQLYREPLEDYAQEEPRFSPHFLALSNRAGEADLHVTESPGSTSLFVPGSRLKENGYEGTDVQHVEQVRLTTIDEWAVGHAPDGIQLIKLDIQGAELAALEGAKRVLNTSTLLVYTEIWFNPAYQGGALFAHIDSFLRTNDFLLYDFYKPKYGSSGMLIWANAIYVHAKRLGHF